MDHPVAARSGLDSFQVLLGARVRVSQGQSSAVFCGGGLAVSLLFQQLAEQIMRFESRTFFDWRRKITAQQAHGERKVAAGAEQHGGRVAQSLALFDLNRFEVVQKSLHIVQAVVAEKKTSEVNPGAAQRLVGGDGGAIFAFRRSGVVVFRGNASGNPVRQSGIKWRNGVGLGTGLVLAAADNARSFEIELSEIGACSPVLQI